LSLLVLQFLRQFLQLSFFYPANYFGLGSKHHPDIKPLTHLIVEPPGTHGSSGYGLDAVGDVPHCPKHGKRTPNRFSIIHIVRFFLAADQISDGKGFFLMVTPETRYCNIPSASHFSSLISLGCLLSIITIPSLFYCVFMLQPHQSYNPGFSSLAYFLLPQHISIAVTQNRACCLEGKY